MAYMSGDITRWPFLRNRYVGTIHAAYLEQDGPIHWGRQGFSASTEYLSCAANAPSTFSAQMTAGVRFGNLHAPELLHAFWYRSTAHCPLLAPADPEFANTKTVIAAENYLATFHRRKPPTPLSLATTPLLPATMQIIRHLLL
jgi:hypothetical protein